jgi:hypothetical protein
VITIFVCKLFSHFGQVRKWVFSFNQAHPHNRLTCDQSLQNNLKTWQNVQRFELQILVFSLQSMTMMVLTIESKSAITMVIENKTTSMKQ